MYSRFHTGRSCSTRQGSIRYRSRQVHQERDGSGEEGERDSQFMTSSSMVIQILISVHSINWSSMADYPEG